MGQILVDTSAWIAGFHRVGFEDLKKELTPLLLSGRMAITGMTLLEILRGASNQEQFNSLKKKISILPVLTVTDLDWVQTAKLSLDLRGKGVVVSLPDVFIAYMAITHHCILYHCDSDFERIAKETNLMTRCFL